MKRVLLRPTARIVALAVIVALSPLPVMAAGDDDQSTKPPGIRASVAKIVKSEPLNATETGAAPAAQGSNDLSTKSFFKSTAGIITLALVGAGVGYALYSTSNDRIKSPAR